MSLSSVAFLAASALVAAAPQCKSDMECPGRAVCVDGGCVEPGHAGGGHSTSSSGSVVAAASEGPVRPAFGIGVFAEFFPSSSKHVPSTSDGQLALLAGGRLGAGVRVPRWAYALVLFEAGYAAAGKSPGDGADGVLIGFGFEGAFARWEMVQPFVRLMFDFRATKLSSSPNGTLADSATTFAIGAKLADIIELHLLFGSDYAGGFSAGVGISFSATTH